MAQSRILKELKDPEISVLVYIVFHTIGPDAYLKWGVIRDGIKSALVLRQKSGLDGYDDNTFNVKLTRILSSLLAKGYVVKEREERSTLYGVTNEAIRKAVHDLFDNPDSMIHVKGIIPIPGFKVKDFEEFREYVIEHGLFHDTLCRAFEEYQEIWEKAHHDSPSGEASSPEKV